MRNTQVQCHATMEHIFYLLWVSVRVPMFLFVYVCFYFLFFSVFVYICFWFPNICSPTFCWQFTWGVTTATFAGCLLWLKKIALQCFRGGVLVPLLSGHCLWPSLQWEVLPHLIFFRPFFWCPWHSFLQAHLTFMLDNLLAPLCHVYLLILLQGEWGFIVIQQAFFVITPTPHVETTTVCRCQSNCFPKWFYFLHEEVVPGLSSCGSLGSIA